MFYHSHTDFVVSLTAKEAGIGMVKEDVMKRIATHKNPDADALAATYLAQTYLFAGETVQIVFVGRAQPRGGYDADCVVDVGNIFDASRLRFDHKPPARAFGTNAFVVDRNASCATKLLYELLVLRGDVVITDLAPLVQTVWEGDANPPRKPSDALLLSRASGFHSIVRQLRRDSDSDAVVYEGARAWLREHESALKQAGTDVAN